MHLINLVTETISNGRPEIIGFTQDCKYLSNSAGQPQPFFRWQFEQKITPSPQIWSSSHTERGETHCSAPEKTLTLFTATAYLTVRHFTYASAFGEGDWAVWNLNLQPIEDDMENHLRSAAFINWRRPKHYFKKIHIKQDVRNERLPFLDAKNMSLSELQSLKGYRVSDCWGGWNRNCQLMVC